MRILVTGGTGFLGSAFVRAALAARHEVAVLTRRAPGARGEGTTWLQGSLADAPWPDIRRFAPEACVHAAWITTPGAYMESPENEDWVRWSVDFLGRLAGLDVRHLTVLGTCIEYQVTGRSMVEDVTPLAPTSLYARSKCALHDGLRGSGWPASGGLAWARVFYPYGEGEHPARLASSLVARLRRGEEVHLRTPRSTKDYIHADDVGTALLAVVEQGFRGAINIGTGQGVAVEEVARALGRLSGRPDLIRVPAETVPDPLDHVVADAGRLRSLGWSPRVTLEAGLRRLVEAHQP